MVITSLRLLKLPSQILYKSDEHLTVVQLTTRLMAINEFFKKIGAEEVIRLIMDQLNRGVIQDYVYVERIKEFDNISRLLVSGLPVNYQTDYGRFCLNTYDEKSLTRTIVDIQRRTEFKLATFLTERAMEHNVSLTDFMPLRVALELIQKYPLDMNEVHMITAPRQFDQYTEELLDLLHG